MEQLIAYSYKDRLDVPPFQVTNENVNVDDAIYVYNMLKEQFQHTRQQWTNATPLVKVKLSFPSLVDPEILSHDGCFFLLSCYAFGTCTYWYFYHFYTPLCLQQ